jgi:hypothetical protein
MSTKSKGAGKMLEFIIKSTISTSIVMGLGYSIFYTTTPSAQEMERRMLASGRYNQKDLDKNKEMARQQMQFILENARSDRPIWDVRGLAEKFEDNQAKK